MHATWSRVGRPPEFGVTGDRKTVKILGAIELWRTRFHYRQDSVFNAETYLAFLELLARHYRRQGAILIQDNASYHKDAEVGRWFAANRQWLEVHQTAGVLPGIKPHGKVVAIHQTERNPQSVLRQSSRAGQHSDASLHRDAVLSRTDPFLLGSLFLNSMSFYLCAPV